MAVTGDELRRGPDHGPDHGRLAMALGAICALVLVGILAEPWWLRWLAASLAALIAGILIGRWLRGLREARAHDLDVLLAEGGKAGAPTVALVEEAAGDAIDVDGLTCDPPSLEITYRDAAAFLHELQGSDEPVVLLANLVRGYHPLDVEETDYHHPEVDPILFSLACDLALVDRQWRDGALDVQETPVASGLSVRVPLRVAIMGQRRMACMVPLAADLTYGDHLRILAMENALNRCLLSLDAQAQGTLRCTGAGLSPTFADHVRFQRQVESSVCAQVMAFENRNPEERGEWAVRHAIALAMARLRLPHRLEATYRVNAAARVVGFEVRATPAEVMAGWRWDDHGERPFRAHHGDRERAAASWNARVCLLVAALTFRCAPAIDEVLVNVTQEDALHRRCLISCRLTRPMVADRDLAHLGDPCALLQRLGASMEVADGALRPVDPTFSLDGELLCPARRFQAPELSGRVLDPASQHALGAHVLSDLSIREDERRRRVVEELGRQLDGSCADDVALLMELARTEADPQLREAARRCARHLIDGAIDAQDHLSLLEDLMAGDGLGELVERAALAMTGQGDGEDVALLAERLRAIDEAGTYADDGTRCHRAFGSYVDRAIFNRLGDRDGRQVELVPPEYVRAHLLLSTSLLDDEKPDRALLHSLRASEVAPLDTASRLRTCRCYEMMGDLPMASATVEELLELAHDPESISLAYYRLAFLLWKQGDLEVADACYRRSIGYPSPYGALARLELMALESTGEVEPVEEGDVEEVLKGHHIPVAPTDAVSEVLLECARASVDAEIFPLARDATALVAMLSGDGAILDLLASLETNPDRPVDEDVLDGPVPDTLP